MGLTLVIFGILVISVGFILHVMDADKLDRNLCTSMGCITATGGVVVIELSQLIVRA